MRGIVTLSALVVAGLFGGVTASSVTAATNTTVTLNVSGRTTAVVLSKVALEPQREAMNKGVPISEIIRERLAS